MKLVRKYFENLFLARWFVTTFALLALLSIVDSVGNADILSADAGTAGALKYMILRLPSLYDRIFLFALFISLLITLLSLIRRQELVGFVSMSVSPLMQVRALIKAVLLVTIVSVIVIDQTLPRTVTALENWLGASAFSEEDAGTPSSLWIAEPDAFVEIKSQRGDVLSDLIIYHRADKGEVSGVTRAASAHYSAGVWQLGLAQTTSFKDATPPVVTQWRTQQTPRTLQKLGTSPRNLSLLELYSLSSLRGSGTRPSSAYQVWALNRLTMPLVAFGFVLVAVPLMQQFGRRQSGDQRLMIGIALGFAYFIIDGVLKTVAEGGGVSVSMAIGLPLGLLLGLGVYLNLEAERVK